MVVDVEVEPAQDGDTSTLVLSGELDLSTATQLSDAVSATLRAPGCRRLALDLADIRFIDSSGINVLIEVRNAARDAEIDLVLSRMSRRVAEVLRLTAVDQLFEIADA